MDDSAVLPSAPDGEIQVRGAAVCHGYTDPSLDADAFTADGWFRTGDRGHLRPDGHVEVTGRTKDLIIRKGEKIAPLELETLLIQHPAVAEVAVVGLPDDERGERVCAVLVLRADAPAPSLAEVAAFLRAKGLMPQKLPEQVEIVSELPRTGLGKVAKLALRDKFSGSLRLSGVSLPAAQLRRRRGAGNYCGTCLHWSTGVRAGRARLSGRLPCRRHDRESFVALGRYRRLTIMELGARSFRA